MKLIRNKKTRKSTPQIKTFWFDLGNVIYFFDFTPAFRRVSRYTHRSPEEIREFFVREAWMEAALDEGKISGRSLFRMLDRELQFQGLTFERFRQIWNDIFKPNRPVIRLIRELKRKGYRLLLISNTNHMHFTHLKRKYPVFKHFDRHLVSYRLKTRKPSARIYREALRHSRAKPHEIFYTDDRRDLIEAANKLHGVHAHVFEGSEGLFKALQTFGLR